MTKDSHSPVKREKPEQYQEVKSPECLPLAFSRPRPVVNERTKRV